MGDVLKRLSLILGVASGVGAFLVSSFWPDKTLPVVLLALVSVFTLGFFFVSYFEAFKEYSRRRSTHLRFNTVLMVFVVFFIMVVLNLIIRQYYFRFDLTTMKRFSLSPLTIKVLEGLEDPIKVYYFGSENTGKFERMQYLLDAYRYHTRKVIYELHDLDRVPLLAKRYGVREYETVVVETGKGFFKDRGSDEQTVTNLIIRATRKRHPVVRFLQGHGEHSLDIEERSGYGIVADVLKKSGFVVDALYLTEETVVPPDTDVLVIASPTRPLRDDELRKIKHYLMGGGKLMVLMDRPGQLSRLLSEFYVSLSKYPIYDTQNVAGIGPSAPLVKEYYYSDISLIKGLEDETFFPGVYEVKFYGAYERYKFLFMVRTTKESWYEKNGDAKKQKDEQEGYQTIIAALVPKDALWRVVISGDSDFATNAYVQIGGNGELFLRAINWLTGEGSLTSIATKRGRVVPVFVTERQLKMVRYLGPIAVPLLIFLSGVVVWFRRRRL